jgi:hypothetical protein
MKVKIKKKGKAKDYTVIQSWKDVNLESWLRLIDDKSTTKSEEAVNTINELSNIPKKLIKELGIQDVALIMSHISKVQQEQDLSLKRIIEIDGVEYGYMPDFEELTLGEYADIETFIKNGLEDNITSLMAILYRPITEKKNNVYTIEAYDGKIKMRAEEMKKMSAEQVQSAMVFFYTFVNVLLKSIKSYLMEQKIVSPQLSQTRDLWIGGRGLV